MTISKKLIEAMTVTLEVTGTQLSDGAVEIMLTDLGQYPELQVLAALRRCCREVRFKLTLADILQRLEDGRPGPEEAWAMCPKDERSSVYWTTEMRDAFSLAYPMVTQGELVPARMTFLERYRALVQQARDARHPVKWEFSPGHDKDGRELVLLDAAEKGRISVTGVRALLPWHRDDEGVNARLLAIEGRTPEKLPPPNPKVTAMVEDLRSKFSGAA